MVFYFFRMKANNSSLYQHVFVNENLSSLFDVLLYRIIFTASEGFFNPNLFA